MSLLPCNRHSDGYFQVPFLVTRLRPLLSFQCMFVTIVIWIKRYKNFGCRKNFLNRILSLPKSRSVRIIIEKPTLEMRRVGMSYVYPLKTGDLLVVYTWAHQ